MSNYSTNNHNSSQKPKRQRRTFSDEFKQDAVNLVIKQDYTKADAARTVNVGYETFSDWHALYAPEPEPCGDDATTDQFKEEKELCQTLHQEGIN